MKPIAIIGMSSIFPNAENLSQYWDNILNELNCIQEVPPSRWMIADYYDPDPNAEDKTYNKYGGFIPDIVFDPMDFGLPPNILEVTDVSQLLGLIVAKNALADAGYAQAGEEILDRTGVILGMVGMSSKLIHPLLNRLQYPIWEKVLRARAVPEADIPAIIETMKLAYIGWNENAFPGAIGNVVAGRIANRLDLGGTNCIVDAACGSSLAAVSMAVNELVSGSANMMITGGVDTDNSILTYLCFSKTPAFSKGDRLRAFSADSDGMLAGEGIGMLVLKRLEDAQRDQNRIYAVIRGVGTSSDGHFKSIYAPRASGQAKALQRAYANADYPPASVGLIEAHGTGTNAGDPSEFEGLREVFGKEHTGGQHIALGSVKSQIGHTKAAAGAASLIKATIALNQKILPATINVSKPNPELKIEETPFYLNTETRPWFNSGQQAPRRAGVSSFGFGGTNFHIALEEYDSPEQPEQRIHSVPFTVLLSAETGDLLVQQCQEALEKLEGNEQEIFLNQLDEDASTASIPISHARLGFIADSVEHARTTLRDSIRLLAENQGQDTWSHPKGIFFRASGMDVKGKTVALFPGQGSQYVNMGRELALNFPSFRKTFEQADEVIMAGGRPPLTGTIFPVPVFTDADRQAQQENLTCTENAQPAIGIFSMALYQLLRDAGFEADYFAGHSFGELTALWAAGVLDDKAFIQLAKTRGEAMGLPISAGQDAGDMLAVKGDVDRVKALLPDDGDLIIANFNSPTQCVLAGSTEAIQAIKPKVEEAGLKAYPLQVSAAFHTRFVSHSQEPFRQAIQQETFRKPTGAVYSNSTARAYAQNVNKVRQTLADHILEPVKFQEEIEEIYRQGGTIFVEIGPKNILTNLVKDILNGKPHETVTLNANAKGSSDTQFRQAVVQMRVLGFNLGACDPYRAYPDPNTTKHSKVAVVLNGGLYVSEKTRADFEKSLLETKPVHENLTAAVHTPAEPAVIATHLWDTQHYQSDNSSGLPTFDNQSSPLFNQEVPMHSHLNQVQPLIEALQTHQNDLLASHEQFLRNDSTSRKIIQEIVQAELAIISKLNGDAQQAHQLQALALMEKNAEFINKQHNGTAEAHQAYLQSQTEFTQQYAGLIQGLLRSDAGSQESGNGHHPAPPEMPTLTVSIPTQEAPIQEPQMPVTASAAPTITVPSPVAESSADLTQVFLQIVSEKTGYPADMLELGMDMEADLGIDSIKRVEILSAMQDQYPHLPVIEAEDLAVLRTLEQIIGTFGQAAPSITAPEPAKAEIPSAMAVEPAKPEIPSMPPGTSTDQDEGSPIKKDNLQAEFLQIVSDKTGYPADMLEMGMDMEADLGIDSIKRVEILSAMQDQYPQLPVIEAEDLAVMRTLEQIITAFNHGSGSPKADPPAPLSSESGVEAPAPEPDAARLAVVVRQIPAPDHLAFDQPADSLTLITDDGTQLSQSLAAALQQTGQKVGVVHFGMQGITDHDDWPDGISHLSIDEAHEDEIRSKMEAFSAANQKIAAFIHLNLPGQPNEKEILALAEQETDLLKTVFLIARHLKKPLEAVGETCRPAFLTVSRMDGQFGLNGNSSNDPLPGGLAGLTKTLRLEWPDIFCRAVDIHPDVETPSAVQMVLAEMHDPDIHLNEVGYTSAGRFTLTLEEASTS